MAPYPQIQPKGIVSLEDVNYSNKRQKLEDNSTSVEVSTVYSDKQIGSQELLSHDWTIAEESINFPEGIRGIPSSDSTKDIDSICAKNNSFRFKETPSVENTDGDSGDLVDNTSSLELPDLRWQDVIVPSKHDNKEEMLTRKVEASGETSASWQYFDFNTEIENCTAEDIPPSGVKPSDETAASWQYFDFNAEIEKCTVEEEPPSEVEQADETATTWLDFVAAYDTNGEKCSKDDIPHRKMEILEQLDSIDRKVKEMEEEEHLRSIQEQKNLIQKMKVDCPHCKKRVAAVRFVLHLSSCFGNGARKCTRRQK